jgi:hypothetical protein
MNLTTNFPASDDAACSAWYVCHPDGQDLGLIAPRFATEAEAIAKRDLWNKDVPGHYVTGITEALPEFSSLPNAELRDRP